MVLDFAFCFIFYFCFYLSPVILQEPFLLDFFFLRVYILSVSRETWKQLTFGKSITRDWG